MCKICSKFTIKTPKQRYWHHSGIFIVNYEPISYNCSGVYIVDFDQVNSGWGRGPHQYLDALQMRSSRMKFWQIAMRHGNKIGSKFSRCIGPLDRWMYSLLNPLSANPTKWSNTLKQFIGKLPTNCLSVFDHFLGLALEGLKLPSATLIWQEERQIRKKIFNEL